MITTEKITPIKLFNIGILLNKIISKANKLKISLDVDQRIHLGQILLTWMFYYFYL